MKLKQVWRWSARERKLRMMRLLWARGDVGFGGYSSKVSLALCVKLVGFSRGLCEWRLTVLGVQVHHQWAYGGIIV